MGVTFKINTKTANGYKSTKNIKNGKEISSLITSSLKGDAVGVIANAVEESVLNHNERVILQAAMFFQRAVTRTPKDEKYNGHKPDDDYVWKSWRVAYGRKSISAEDVGSKYFENENDFNNAKMIKDISQIIKDNLFSGGKTSFEKRPKKIRGIRIENPHPRFAMLEYGTYVPKNSTPKEGPKHWHGIQDGYSVQAPYGMLRITQAEMSSMSIQDFDKWLVAKKHKKELRVPTQAQIKKLVQIIGDKTHLSDSDIEAITEVYNK